MNRLKSQFKKRCILQIFTIPYRYNVSIITIIVMIETLFCNSLSAVVNRKYIYSYIVIVVYSKAFFTRRFLLACVFNRIVWSTLMSVPVLHNGSPFRSLGLILKY